MMGKVRLLFILAYFTCFLGFSQTWLSGYCYRKSITIDASKVGGSSDLTNFPMLLSVTDASLMSTGSNGLVENENGYDIRVTDAAHTELGIQIESFDSATGEYIAWVNVPTIDHDDNTTLYLYYGNSSISADPSTDTLWDDNYAGVWHLNEATGAQVLDATDNNNDENLSGGIPHSDTFSENTETSSIPAVIGNGRSFDNVGNLAADNGYIEIPHVESNSLDITGQYITIEVWARMYEPAPQDAPFVIKTEATNAESYMFGLQNGTNRLNRRVTTSNTAGYSEHNDNCRTDGHWRYDNDNPGDADWHYYVMVYDGTSVDAASSDSSKLATFVDGAIIDFPTTPNDGACSPYPFGNLEDNNGDVFFGRRVGTSANRYFRGAMDEIRISNIARDSGWIATTYSNLNSPETFYSLGDEEYPIEGGTATSALGEIDNGESTTISISGHDETATLQWQNSTDNSSFSDMSGQTGTSVSTGALTQTTYYRVISTKDGCDAISSTAIVSVRATFDNDYAYRRNITIDNTKVDCSSNLTDFPVLISISGDDDLKQSAGKVQSANGYDIIFRGSDGSALSHDLEEYDGTAGDLIVWVKIPTLFCNANTVIQMYYGDCDFAGGDPSATGTWSNSYTGVYHMNDNPTGTIDDRTANLDDGTAINFDADTRTTGQIGQAINFDGNNDFITFGEDPMITGASARTYSAWVNVDQFLEGGIFAGGNTGGNDFSLVTTASENNFRAEFGTESNEYTFASSLDNWKYVTLTYDGSNVDIYLDGVLFDTRTATLNTPTGQNVLLGEWADNHFDGIIDEFTISSAARSESWISTQYNNQSSPSTFYSIGDEVSEFVWNGSVDNDWNDPANWSTCTVPNATDDVVIPTGLTNYPQLDQNRTNNDVSIASGASLDLGGFELTITDDFDNDGTFTHSNGKIIFGGNKAEQVIKGDSEIDFYALEINKSGGKVILNKNVDVENVFTLTDGFLDLDDDTLNITASGSISGGSSTSFIVADGDDCLKQRSLGTGFRTGNIIFPVGTDTASYTPVTLNNSGTSDDFCVNVCQGIYEDGACSGTAFDSKVVNKTWNVDPVTGTGLDVEMTLQWNDADMTGDYDLSAAYVAHYTGSAWNRYASQDISSQTEPYVLTQSNVTSFSPQGSGSDDQGLPVELMRFAGKLVNEAVRLEWSTASEINNEKFVVEKSLDGNTFYEIATVKGSGTTISQRDYDYTDSRLNAEVHYYRLRQIDFDGTEDFSSVIRISTIESSSSARLVVQPVPANEELVIITDLDLISFEILNMMGQKLITGPLERNADYKIDIVDLENGQYVLKLKSEKNFIYRRIIKDLGSSAMNR